MISYPIDYQATRGRWYLHDTQTGQTSKMSGTGNWPNAEGTEIVGLASHLVPVLKVTADRPADIDERLVRLVGEQQPVDLEANEIRVEWNIVARSDAEKKEVIANIEYEEANRHIDVARELIETRIVLAMVLRSIKNLNVPASLKAIADNYEAKAQKLYNNRLKIHALMDAVDAGQLPVLDQEFEPVD